MRGEFIHFFQDETLWACLAAMSAYAKELSTAEIAYAAIEEVISSIMNRTFSYSTKEPRSNIILIQFYTGRSIEWHESFVYYCAHSKILQNVSKSRSIQILF